MSGEWWMLTKLHKPPGSQLGISLIEVIIAIALFSIIASGVVVLALGSFRNTSLAEQETAAMQLLDQSVAAVESIRNQDWGNLTEGSYGLAYDGTNWAFVAVGSDDAPTPFNREITITNGQRDNDNLVESGGSPDANTKKIELEVQWSSNTLANKTRTRTLYLTNWLNVEEEIDGVTTVIESCDEYCLSEGYQAGTCRTQSAQCAQKGENYETDGDQYCSHPKIYCCCEL